MQYLESKKEWEKKQKKEIKDLEVQTKKNTVRSIASVMAMAVVLDKGGVLTEPTDDDEKVVQGVQHLSKCINSLLSKDGGAYEWSRELDGFCSEIQKVVLGLSSSFPEVSMSYKDFAAALPDVLGKLPAVIDDKIEDEEVAEEEANDDAIVDAEPVVEDEAVEEEPEVTS